MYGGADTARANASANAMRTTTRTGRPTAPLRHRMPHARASSALFRGRTHHMNLCYANAAPSAIIVRGTCGGARSSGVRW
jgi:hypothetical protein